MPLLSLADLPERYAFLDPASGTTQVKKANQARSAIVCIVVDQLGHVFVVESWADRVSPTDIMERAFEIHTIWQPRVFGIEASAQQSLFYGLVNEEAYKRGIRASFMPVHQPTQVHKDERIRNQIQPLGRAGRLFVPPTHQTLRHELATFPTGLTKDLVDALASACALVPPRRPRQAERSESHALAIMDYLERSGASSTVRAAYEHRFLS